jgi:hypothetical protein
MLSRSMTASTKARESLLRYDMHCKVEGRQKTAADLGSQLERTGLAPLSQILAAVT